MMERSKCIVQSCKRGCIEQASLMSAVKTSEVDSAWYHWLLKTCGETCGGINVDNSMFHVCSFHRRDKEQLEWGLCSTVDFVETLPVAKVTRAASMREHYSGSYFVRNFMFSFGGKFKSGNHFRVQKEPMVQDSRHHRGRGGRVVHDGDRTRCALD